jgi:hypothetical protein
MNEKLEGWVTEHGGVRFCPVCRAKVEKNEGCNHMTCIICKYEFCWFCLGYAGHDARHFDPLNPYSCGAGQFDRTATRWPIINYLKFIISFIIAVALMPILYVCFFIFGGLGYGYFAFLEVYRTKNCLVGLIGAFLGLIAGVLIGALLSPLAAISFVVSILYAIFVGLKFLCLTMAMKIRGCCSGRIERPEETIARERAL